MYTSIQKFGVNMIFFLKENAARLRDVYSQQIGTQKKPFQGDTRPIKALAWQKKLGTTALEYWLSFS